MTVGTRFMTAEELERMPADHSRHELVNGELRSMAPAGFDHGTIIGKLTYVLGAHVYGKKLGVIVGAETGFRLSSNPDTVRAPALAFVAASRVPTSGAPAGYWPGAPDLAVEVLSPGDTVFEIEEKVANYLAAGSRAVWVVNPRRRTVTVYRSNAEPRVLPDSEMLEGGDVVTGFKHPVHDIFAA
jgi:Uma2 family endonuclease